jgi:hypothetical protein
MFFFHVVHFISFTGDPKYEENWKELTKLLNNTLGPKKTVDEWKMVFYNWKGQLRTRAKKLKQIQDGKTGVDDKLALQKLTDVEKRALKLWKEDFQDKDIASVSISTAHELILYAFVLNYIEIPWQNYTF